ncbi:MAG: hypothetical protein ACFB0B_05955 [Thermonemataceae bacterium]
MKRLTSLLLFALLPWMGCKEENQIYKNIIDDFPQGEWLPDRTLSFEFEVDNAETAYNCFILLRHAYGFRETTIPLDGLLITPSGEEQPFSTVVAVREGEEYLSSCMGDLCDLEMILTNLSPVEQGTYKISLSQERQLAGILSIGLRVETKEN